MDEPVTDAPTSRTIYRWIYYFGRGFLLAGVVLFLMNFATIFGVLVTGRPKDPKTVHELTGRWILGGGLFLVGCTLQSLGGFFGWRGEGAVQALLHNRGVGRS